MKFYDIPKSLSFEIKDLEKAIDQFKAGKLHPTKFRAIRVPFGIYEQRQENTFMLRIRATAGGITPLQLETTALIAKEFAKPMVHITTRQELQIHDAILSDAPEILTRLLSVGLSTRGGGGNTVRNIMASHDSGINPEEIFDVTPHAVALSSRLIAEKDSWNFPRKFKISFSSTSDDNALAAFNDLGFIAQIKDGKKGFKVFVAGGLGCRPRLSKVLHEFINENQVYQVSSAIKHLFLIHGNRKSKNSARLRFLWDELGEQKFLNLYKQEFEKASKNDILELEDDLFLNQNHTVEFPPHFINIEAFDIWKNRYVKPQKQEGLKSVLIPVPSGDLSSDHAIKLAKFLKQIGDNSIRFTMTQNINLRNIPMEYLGNLFELVNEIETESHLSPSCANITICAGADTCTTGVCLPKNVVSVIKKYLNASKNLDELPDDFRINISGCPNSCGQHHIGDIGLFGRIARANERALPGYWITGGANRNPDDRAFTRKCGWVPSRDLPAALTMIVDSYVKVKENYQNFKAYFADIGKTDIKMICKKFSSFVPFFENDKSYYTDWGAKKEFSTAHMGHGECSAGVYDMIEVEMKNIKHNIKNLGLPDFAHSKAQILKDIVFSGASMLLITRGVDPETQTEIYNAFIEHFIDKKLVDDKFKPFIGFAIEKNTNKLMAQEDLIVEFGETMIKLYHSMDNSLRFPGEEIIPMKVSKTEKSDEATLFKDLRNVACPMNFVKTKVELAKIGSKDTLKIYLDSGEPIDNVPRSVVSEGHKILKQEKTDDFWTVIIEKQ